MLRVRLAFSLYGLLIIWASSTLASVELSEESRARMLLGVKLLGLPFAMEYAIGVIRASVERQVRRGVVLVGPRLILYSLTILICAASSIVAAPQSTAAAAHIALSVVTLCGIEMFARLTRHLVCASVSAQVPNVRGA